MSKKLAAFYGQKSFKKKQAATPQEYTVLGINQPLIAPEIAPEPESPKSQTNHPSFGAPPRKFRFSLLLNKLL